MMGVTLEIPFALTGVDISAAIDIGSGNQLSIPVLLTFLSALINIATGLFLLYQRKRKEIISYGAFAIFIGLCYVFMALFQWSRTIESVTWSTLLYSFFGGLIGPTFFMFSLYYSGKSLPVRWILLLFVPILAIYSIFFMSTQTFISGVTIGSEASRIKHNWGRLLSDSIWLSYVISAYYVLVGSYRKRPLGSKKTEHKFVLISTALPFAMAVIIHIFLPAAGDYSLTFIGPLTSWFFIALTAILILRHQLFDIRVILRKSFVYSALIAAVFAAYFIIIELVRTLSPEQSTGALQLVFLVVLVLLSLLFPLLKRLEGLSEKLIFSQYNQSRQRLLTLGDQLLETTHLQALTTLFVNEINAVYAPAFIDLWGQYPGQPQLERLRQLGESGYTHPQIVELATSQIHSKSALQLLPVSETSPQSLIYQSTPSTGPHTLILLGPQKSGTPYTFQDLPLLEDLCRILVTSLRHALLHEQQRELLLLKEHQIRTANAALSDLESADHLNLQTDLENAEIPLALESADPSPLAFSNRIIATALRKLDHPTIEVQQAFAPLACLQRLQSDGQLSAAAALKQLLTTIVDYFRPANDVGVRTRNRIKYEILRMMAHDSATEEQIMWELGFEPESDFWARQNPDKARPPRYPYQGKGDYAATSRASFKRLKQEALADVLWRLGVVERG